MISIFFFFLILLGRARLVVGSPYDEWDESRTGCLDNAVKQNEDMEHSWTKLCVLGFSSFLIGAQSKCDGKKVTSRRTAISGVDAPLASINKTPAARKENRLQPQGRWMQTGDCPTGTWRFSHDANR